MKKIYISILIAFFTVFMVFADSDLINFRNGVDNKMYTMITENNLAGVESLIKEGADVNAVDEYNMTTPLIAASERGYVEIAELLIENGAEVNKYVSLGVNALDKAADSGNLNVVKLLIDKGADVNLAKGYKETALMYASLSGHIDIVKYLVEKGADLNLQNIEGVTALMLAAQIEGNIELVKFLVLSGADPNIKNINGGLASAWAGRNKEIADFLINIEQ